MRAWLIAGLAAAACVTSSADDGAPGTQSTIGGSGGAAAATSGGSTSSSGGRSPGSSAGSPSEGGSPVEVTSAGGSPSAGEGSAGGSHHSGAPGNETGGYVSSTPEGGASLGGRSSAGEGGTGGEQTSPVGGGGLGGNENADAVCDYPESDAVYHCAGLCGPGYISGECECNQVLHDLAPTFVLMPGGKLDGCSKMCGWHNWALAAGQCGRFTAMSGSGVGFGLADCSEKTGCFIAGATDGPTKVIASKPLQPTWIHIDVANLESGACPLSCD